MGGVRSVRGAQRVHLLLGPFVNYIPTVNYDGLGKGLECVVLSLTASNGNTSAFLNFSVLFWPICAYALGIPVIGGMWFVSHAGEGLRQSVYRKRMV